MAEPRVEIEELDTPPEGLDVPTPKEDGEKPVELPQVK